MWVLDIAAWPVLGLQMEERASWHGEYLRIYWIRSCVQPTVCGPQNCGLGEGLTMHHRKTQLVRNITQVIGIGGLSWIW